MTRSASPAAPLSGRALRTHRRDLALDVVRLGSALATVSGAAGAAATRDVAVAHLALAVVSAAALVADLRAPHLVPRAALTWATLGFWVGATVLWHDVAGAGSALGVLVLLEAGLRFGLLGGLVSGVVVTGTALLLPQVDATGATGSPWQTLLIVALLLPPAVWLRAGTERATSHAERAETAVSDALSALPVGVVVLDGSGTVLHANTALRLLLGDGDPTTLLHALAAPHQRDVLEQVLAGEAAAGLELATPHEAHLAVGASRTRDGHVVVHVQDVSEAHRERERLALLANVDALTGVSSRAAGERTLERAHGTLALLFVDLDGVKRLNDRHGHAVGDAVLAQTGQRLRGLLREGDLAVRWGGDEFVLLVEVQDADEAHAVAERVVAGVREPVQVSHDLLVEVTASIGLALTSGGTSGLVARADAAMYDAKRAGGDRVVRCATPGAART